MKRFASLIIGFSIFLPLSASAATINVVKFDTAADGTSLYQNLLTGKMDQRIHLYASVIDATTGAEMTFDDTSFAAQILALKVHYANAYLCASKIDLGKCKMIPKKPVLQ